MPKYGAWIEVTQHYWHVVEAASPEEAEEKIRRNESSCEDSQETWHLTDVQLVDK
jgi:hypothetical protein